MTLTTVPTGPHAFQAYVEFPDGRDPTLAVRGDQVLVDARILKWRYLASLIGLHTEYELDRLTGRYADIDDERTLEALEVSVSTTGLLVREVPFRQTSLGGGWPARLTADRPAGSLGATFRVEIAGPDGGDEWRQASGMDRTSVCR